MMAFPSKLLLLLALAVMKVEANRNVSVWLHRHRMSGLAQQQQQQQQQQQWQQREARAATAHQNDWAIWDDFMSDTYGVNWEDEDSSRNLDAARCMQWAVYRKDVIEDKNDPEASEDDRGQNGCISALLREAILGSLDKKTFEWEEKVKQYSVLQTGPANGGDDISVKVRTWNPLLCQAIAQRSRSVCQVRVYGVDEFAKLRKSAAMPNRMGPVDFSDNIAKSIEKGPLVFFSPGAGKSRGSSFSTTSDGNFKIKLGIRKDMTMNEPKHFLKILVGTSKAPSMLQHLERNTNSLLNRYLSLIKLRALGQDKYALLMMDASYGEDARIQKMKRSIPLMYTRYDLKGKSRDQDEKQKTSKQFTLLNGDFKEREKNYLDLTKDQCRKLRQAVQADTAFLEGHNLIDYSLFVGVTHGESNGCKATAGEPFCFEATKSLTYTFCLLDYINNFNFAKGIENIFKGGKFTNYGQGINNFISQICPGRLEWYESTEFRMCCAIIVFVLTVAAGGAGLWYWRNRTSPVKQPVHQVPWQQGPAPRMPQYRDQDDFGIAHGQPQGYIRQQGMNGGRGFA
mmetsp:Transcript_86301/g.166118  ORF Transcript_86301/g.166118 Transcript_86301/m.166118 type:complete len:568 (+) Transcript_86301:47-1750(+)